MTKKQGHQLTKDLNVIVARGKNLALPVFWAPLLRYVSGPILAIVFGFSYPTFHGKQMDPLHIFGFMTAHVVLVLCGLGLVVPRWFSVLIPAKRRKDGKHAYAPSVTFDPDATENQARLEGGDTSDVGAAGRGMGDGEVLEDDKVAEKDSAGENKPHTPKEEEEVVVA